MPSPAAYVYCLVRAATRPASGAIPPGIPEASRPEALPAGRGVWAIVSDVPLDVYGPNTLETALRDIDWVSRVAVAHERVVEHFTRARAAAVVPLKLFTMFSTRERAVDAMARRGADLAPVWRRIRGADEWGVRVMRAPGPVAPGRSRRAPVSGAAFLAEKKRARDAAFAADAAAAESAEAAFAALQRIARAATRRDDAPAGASSPLLDAAFLVPRTKRAAFKAAARLAAARCSEARATLSLSGPWPAYNFVQPPARAGARPRAARRS